MTEGKQAIVPRVWGQTGRRIVWLGVLLAWALFAALAAPAHAATQSLPMPDLSAPSDTADAAEAQFLPPREAFALSVVPRLSPKVTLHFEIAKGYYLYRDRIKVSLPAGEVLPLDLPQGEVKQDPTFGAVQVYHHSLDFELQVPATATELRVGFQGCADGGICYPPDSASLTLVRAGENLAVKVGAYQSDVDVEAMGRGGISAALQTALTDPAPAQNLATELSPVPQSATAAPAQTVAQTEPAPSEGWWSRLQGYYDSPQSLFDRHNALLLAGIFFVLGVMLSLTPCVLPMLPILSAILTRQHGHAAKPSSGFFLSLAYSVGVMAVYTLLGVLAGLAGQGLAPLLQTPWVMGVFATLMAVLALSMFGVYELRLPHRLTQRLDAASRSLPGGQYGSVILMGGLSALLVSPCVSAPLAGAMLFISQSQDVVLGGLALMMLSLGMCVPLLLLGASAGWLLPRAGHWMDGVKVLFGFMLLSVAVYMIHPFLPTAWTLAGAGLLLLMAGCWLRPFAADPELSLGLVLQRALALLLVALGLMQWVGVMSQGRSVLQPLSGLSVRAAPAASSAKIAVFEPVHSVADFDARVKTAQQQGQKVVLDFYADWCVSCVEMEEQTFPQPEVAQRLKAAVLLRADVTAMTPDQRELLRRFRLFGPPGLIFVNAQGQEQHRVVGFQPPARFVRSLDQAGL